MGRWLEAKTIEVKGRGPEPMKAMEEGTRGEWWERMVKSRRASLR